LRLSKKSSSRKDYRRSFFARFLRFFMAFCSLIALLAAYQQRQAGLFTLCNYFRCLLTLHRRAHLCRLGKLFQLLD